MTVFYLESSALLKRYLPEQGSGVLDQILDERRPHELLATSLFTVLEVTTTFYRLANAGHLEGVFRDQLLSRFNSDLRTFHLDTFDSDLLGTALQVVSRHHLRSGDALHMAALLRLASFTTQSSEPVVALTSDRELAAACRSENILILDPNLESAQDTLRQIRLM